MTESATAETEAPATVEPETKPKKKQDSFAVFLIKLVVIVLVFRTFIFTSFMIPSESMMPRLLEGDYLFAAKWPYGYSRASLPLDTDWVGDGAAERFEPAARLAAQTAQIPRPMRPQRMPDSQVDGSPHELVVEKNMKLARPARLSIGTNPTPWPATGGKRLSAEWSRLSPITNTWPSGTMTGLVVSRSLIPVSSTL